ncbi:hypothetical protein [Natrinema caseinilyticum]|uniref:hypothetical protein n=1 Tax=Natrinema caseinilyticum TaxID=2961570 RepID=UPI0020C496C8|nr:hypothetical protein [Natrinema caseinilyticum]
MNRITTITLATMLVVAAIAVPLAAASVVSSSGSREMTDSEAGNESIEPGEQFAAALGVQNAEIEGDVSNRAYGVRIANAETDRAKAAIAADQFEETETRLADLEARLEALNESRAAGELGAGRYRAEVATTVAEMRTVEQQAAAVERTAAGLPEAVLADHDIDVESVQTLRDRAGDLGGPETAAIARSVAGDEIGRSIGTDRESGAPIGTDGEERDDGRGHGSENETTAESTDETTGSTADGEVTDSRSEDGPESG